jgi:hypothetical protein
MKKEEDDRRWAEDMKNQISYDEYLKNQLESSVCVNSKEYKIFKENEI